MPDNQRLARGTAVGMLSFAKDTDTAIDFMDFLASPQSQQFYEKYGWWVP